MATIHMKHVFGSKEKIAEQYANGLLEPYTICALDEGYIGFIDRDGNFVSCEAPTPEAQRVKVLDALPETGEYDYLYLVDKSLYVWKPSGFVGLNITKEELRLVQNQLASVSNSISQIRGDVIALGNSASDETAALSNQIANLEHDHHLIEEKLEGKVDAADVYCKPEVDAMLAGKVDDGTYYTKEQVDAKLSGKAPVSHSHITGNIQGLAEWMAEKADIDSPHFTGIPVAPTALPHIQTFQVANCRYVANEIGDLYIQMKDYTDQEVQKILAGTGFATEADGILARTALQPGDIGASTAAGCFSVKGTNVRIAGLGSAAYKDAAGTINSSYANYVPTVKAILDMNYATANYATDNAAGLMTAADKKKLDALGTVQSTISVLPAPSTEGFLPDVIKIPAGMFMINCEALLQANNLVDTDLTIKLYYDGAVFKQCTYPIYAHGSAVNLPFYLEHHTAAFTDGELNCSVSIGDVTNNPTVRLTMTVLQVS